jgi:hypothetical protein
LRRSAASDSIAVVVGWAFLLVKMLDVRFHEAVVDVVKRIFRVD